MVNPRYRDIAWPLRCKGDASDTSCKIDNTRLEGIAKQRLKEEAKTEVENKLKGKLKEELGEELGEDLGNTLKDALDKLLR